MRHWRRNLFLRWLLAATIGEVVSFGVPVLVAVTMNTVIGEPKNTLTAIIIIGTMMLAGSVEGFALGFAQWVVLHHYIHKLACWRWVLATATVAVLAWGVGQSTFTLLTFFTGAEQSSGPGTLLMTVSAALLGFVLGAMMGFAQWLVLRPYIRNAGWWVLASAAGWAMGMVVIFAGASIIPDGASVALMVIIGLVSAAAMGATFAAITGIALVRLLQPRLLRI